MDFFWGCAGVALILMTLGTKVTITAGKDKEHPNETENNN